MTRTTACLWIGYVLFLTAIVFGVFEGRRRMLNSLDTTEARAGWNAWREETVALSTGTGPMKRREAKALEPPLLIMLRDYFGTAMCTALLTMTMFYWFLAFLIRGALQPTTREVGP